MRLGLALLVVVGACSPFEESTGTTTVPAPPIDEAGAPMPSDAGSGPTPPPGPVSPEPCRTFEDGFEAFPGDGWASVQGANAAVTVGPAWSGKALVITFQSQAQGSTTGLAFRSAKRTLPTCPLKIAFDVRLTGEQGSARLVLFRVRSNNADLDLSRQSGRWYLRSGNMQTEVPTPTPEPDTGKVRVALLVEEDGNGAKTTFTTGTMAKTHRDPATGIGSGNATLYFGGVLEGATTGGLTLAYDDVSVSW